ncbi:MAG: helix-turn-helix domain-containing protein [Rhodopseudomonas sp.]|nr:helix-turn-helix domain-containing protein [Rhodopseudomonas sp.]
MTPLLHIRRHVLKVTQKEMAAIAGVKQPTISRWERGIRQPALIHLSRIRSEAKRRRIKWNDRILFDSGRAA